MIKIHKHKCSMILRTSVYSNLFHWLMGQNYGNHNGVCRYVRFLSAQLYYLLGVNFFFINVKVCIRNFLQNYFKSVWCAPIRSSSKNAVIDFVEGQEDCHLSWKNTTTIVCRSKKKMCSDKILSGDTFRLDFKKSSTDQQVV